MEHPRTWDLLTSSLAVSDLSREPETWAFLVIQGLVRDGEREREAFAKVTRAEGRRGDITGPSLPCRIAGGLRRELVTLPPADRADPEGELAVSRVDAVRGWRDEPPRNRNPRYRRPPRGRGERWWRFWVRKS
jgi:hypothetical protein